MTPPGRGAQPRRSPSARGPASNQRRVLVRPKTAGTLRRSWACRRSRRVPAHLRSAPISVYFAACSKAWRVPIRKICALSPIILQPLLERETSVGFTRSAFTWMNCAALAAGAEPFIRVKPLEERRKVAHDALQLDLDAVEKMVALLAVPLEAVPDARGAGALDHQAQAACFWALRRMPHMWRHKEDRAFLQLESPGLPVLHQIEKGVALHLVEEFLVGIVVVVGALVRPADDGNDEIRVLPDLRVADRRLEQMPVLLDPFLEVERFQHGGAALTV